MPDGKPAPRVSFDTDDFQRIERAAEVGEYDDVAAFIREGALRLVAKTIDGDGLFSCLHDDCDKTFGTIRERRGHYGRVHVQEFPEGDFWCGYCGFGPSPWQGINAHHSQRHKDQGDPVRLGHDPDPDELLAPDELPDHMDRELLKDLYVECHGNISEMCRQYDFDVTDGRVRHYLIEYGIHDVTPKGTDVEGADHRDKEFLERLYKECDGNMREMYRRHDFDVGYSKLVGWCRDLGVHKPGAPKGRHGNPSNTRAYDNRAAREKPDEEDDDDEADETSTGPPEDPDQRVYVLEWGRWGPPLSGVYHEDPDCWTLHRPDTDRDVVPLPWPREEVEEDDDWDACGHCSADEDDEAEDVESEVESEPDPEPEPEPEPVEDTQDDAGPPLDMGELGIEIGDPWQTDKQEDRGGRRFVEEQTDA